MILQVAQKTVQLVGRLSSFKPASDVSIKSSACWALFFCLENAEWGRPALNRPALKRLEVKRFDINAGAAMQQKNVTQ